ncbi:hypothetical protein COOONC_27046 [Cooperia oncophora]
MRRSCSLCGQVANVDSMRRMYPSSRKPNFILAALLSLLGLVDRALVDSVWETLCRNRIYVCHIHVVRAWKNRVVLRRPDAEGSTAYFCTDDIPTGLVENNMAISARDVWSFINAAMKKYRGTSLWPEHYAEEEEGMLEEADRSMAAPGEHGDPDSVVKEEMDQEEGSVIKTEADCGDDTDNAEECEEVTHAEKEKVTQALQHSVCLP